MSVTFRTHDAISGGVEKDNQPCTVRIRVSASQVPYLRTLPLHHSQREIETALYNILARMSSPRAYIIRIFWRVMPSSS